jgi:sulfur carrier protein ThiS
MERTQEATELEFTGSAKDLLDKLHICAEDVLIIRNGQLVTEDESLETTDSIKLLSVISGG